MVSTSFSWSQSDSAAWSSMLPTASTAAWSTSAAAKASAASSGTSPSPYISPYFATNSALPGVSASTEWLTA